MSKLNNEQYCRWTLPAELASARSVSTLEGQFLPKKVSCCQVCRGLRFKCSLKRLQQTSCAFQCKMHSSSSSSSSMASFRRPLQWSPRMPLSSSTLQGHHTASPSGVCFLAMCHPLDRHVSPLRPSRITPQTIVYHPLEHRVSPTLRPSYIKH